MTKLFYSIMILLFLAVTNVTAKNTPSPRIVNIINFIRQLEPRDSKISEEVLYETVHKQVELLKKYNMRGTFLLQYDALINPRYQSLLKEEVRRGNRSRRMVGDHSTSCRSSWTGMERTLSMGLACRCRFCYRIYPGREGETRRCIYGEV